jgi:hypothetical protein
MSSEHENWVRYNSLRQARKINPGAKLEELIQDAAKISNFVLERPTGVVSIVSEDEID